MSLKLMALLYVVITDIVFAFLYYAGVNDIEYYILSFSIIYLAMNLFMGTVNRRVKSINNIIMISLIIVSLVIIIFKVLPMIIKPVTR